MNVLPIGAKATTKDIAMQAVGVVKSFNSAKSTLVALDGVDLDVFDGEFLTILGPSGCGKTTLLRVFAGFENPDTGDVVLGGATITDVPPNERPLAMVFQNYALFPHLNVADNVGYGLKVAGVGKEERAERVDVALTIMDLSGLGERLPNQLSGGQQQRVALARSIVIQPQVLLFDEPLSNLDARLRDQMRSELRRLQRQLGITSVYVTHDQNEAMAMSDRIVVMNHGRIEQIGSPREIYEEPVSLFVANFVGQANVLEAAVESASDGSATAIVLGGRTTAKISGDLNGSSKAAMVVRPESIELSPQEASSSTAGRNALSTRGTIRTAEYLGSSIHYTVELDDGTIILVTEHRGTAAASLPFQEGEPVEVWIPSTGARLVPSP
jgi:iron(III) transport system ATP-binding protein